MNPDCYGSLANNFNQFQIKSEWRVAAVLFTYRATLEAEQILQKLARSDTDNNVSSHPLVSFSWPHNVTKAEGVENISLTARWYHRGQYSWMA